MKPTVCYDAHFSVPRIISLASSDATIYSTRSPKKLTHNEDSMAIIPIGKKINILVVADGMSGMPNGEKASKIVIQELISQLQNISSANRIENVILTSLIKTNNTLMSESMATTVTITVINQQAMRIYHAGDSTAMLFDKTGALKFQTNMHSPIGHALKSGILSEQDAFYHQARHIISNYIGYKDMYIEPSKDMVFSPSDTLLMASDAMTDNLHLQQIQKIITNKNILEAANTLAYECRRKMMSKKNSKIKEGGHPDDLSIILLRNKK